MLQEKRKDLDHERQKQLLQKMVSELSRLEPGLYYQSTSAVAQRLKSYLRKGAQLSVDDRSLMQKLSVRDIEMLLSLH
jgi:hypothetical protein